LWIGVRRASLSYKDACTAAEAATSLLTGSGLDDFEIAFRETVVIHCLRPDPPQPTVPSGISLEESSMFAFCKPFTHLLGLPISSSASDGTGALYLRDSKDSDQLYLLTCSHVVRP
ncbi:hypothetical protein F5878DRAFT_495429, partial [Lentinula raphanica]